jgi:hypothetical protein
MRLKPWQPAEEATNNINHLCNVSNAETNAYDFYKKIGIMGQPGENDISQQRS